MPLSYQTPAALDTNPQDSALGTTCTTFADTTAVVRKRKDRGNKKSSSKKKIATQSEGIGSSSMDAGEGEGTMDEAVKADSGGVDSYKQDIMSRLLGLS
jgi:hypothetical protein